MDIRKSQTDMEKQKVQICTPLIKPIAFSCKSWILSTKNVEKLVFTSCKMQLSDNLSINNKSLSKPRIVHIFWRIVFTEAETLSKETHKL